MCSIGDAANLKSDPEVGAVVGMDHLCNRVMIVNTVGLDGNINYKKCALAQGMQHLLVPPQPPQPPPEPLV